MAENETPETQENQEPVFSVQRVYLKETSLEQPNSPAIFLEQDAPSMDMQLAVEANQVADGVYEVVVTTTVQTKVKERTLFLIEAKQAGIFEVRNLPTEQTDHVLGITCPQIVYPYLRSNVADIIQRTGLPPIHLGEINFQALYEQRQQEEQGGGDKPEAANGQDKLQ